MNVKSVVSNLLMEFVKAQIMEMHHNGVKNQNGELPVGLTDFVQRAFLCAWS